MIWTWIWLIVGGAEAAAAGASRRTKYEATDSNLVNILVNSSTISLSPLTSIPEVVSLSLTVDTSVFETATQGSLKTVPLVLGTQSATPTTGTPQTNEQTDRSQTAGEPDSPLQIVLSILGTLLALASVVVAAFFGYRQLRGTQHQPVAARHDTRHHTPGSGSGADLEMGPVIAPSSVYQNPATPIDDLLEEQGIDATRSTAA